MQHVQDCGRWRYLDVTIGIDDVTGVKAGEFVDGSVVTGAAVVIDDVCVIVTRRTEEATTATAAAPVNHSVTPVNHRDEAYRGSNNSNSCNTCQS